MRVTGRRGVAIAVLVAGTAGRAAAGGGEGAWPFRPLAFTDAGDEETVRTAYARMRSHLHQDAVLRSGDSRPLAVLKAAGRGTVDIEVGRIKTGALADVLDHSPAAYVTLADAPTLRDVLTRVIGGPGAFESYAAYDVRLTWQGTTRTYRALALFEPVDGDGRRPFDILDLVLGQDVAAGPASPWRSSLAPPIT